MAIARVDIDLAGIRDLQTYLADMEKRITDFSVPLTEGSHLMLADIMEAIATHGSSWGEPWESHAPATEEKWGAHSMLDLTGRMIASLTRFVRPMLAGVEGNATTILMEHGRGSAWRGDGGGDGTEMPDRNIMGRKEETADLIISLCLDYAIDENGRIAA